VSTEERGPDGHEVLRLPSAHPVCAQGTQPRGSEASLPLGSAVQDSNPKLFGRQRLGRVWSKAGPGNNSE
jgi:hypothetical protein